MQITSETCRAKNISRKNNIVHPVGFELNICYQDVRNHKHKISCLSVRFEISDELHVFLPTVQHRKSYWPRDQTSINIYLASHLICKICSGIWEVHDLSEVSRDPRLSHYPGFESPYCPFHRGFSQCFRRLNFATCQCRPLSSAITGASPTCEQDPFRTPGSKFRLVVSWKY
jgi:hypothetical protein